LGGARRRSHGRAGATMVVIRGVPAPLVAAQPSAPSFDGDPASAPVVRVEPIAAGPTRARFQSVRLTPMFVIDVFGAVAKSAGCPRSGRAAARPIGGTISTATKATIGKSRGSPRRRRGCVADTSGDRAIRQHGMARDPQAGTLVTGHRRRCDRPDAMYEGDDQALVELRATRILEAGQRLVDG